MVKGLLFDTEGDRPETYSLTREHPDVARKLRELSDRATKEIVAPS